MGEQTFSTIGVVAEIVEKDAGEISNTTRLEDLGWDSLAVVSFIAAVDEGCSKILSPKAVVACKTVGDLERLAAG